MAYVKLENGLFKVKKIYLTTRLFNLDDKLRTCKLEKYLKENFNVKIYMPYRDSDEENISQNNWKQEIFKMDVMAIEESDLLIGYLDGPEFDEGVGFEIGYAVTRGKQVIILNTDFISYSTSKNIMKSIDPLVECLNIDVITLDNYYIDSQDFCDNMKELSEQLLKLIHIDSYKKKIIIERHEAKIEYFIETGSSRIFNYFVRDKKSSNRMDTQCGKDDLDNILSSKKVYIFSNGAEMHFGSAIIAGICYGYKIPFYIVDDKKIYLVGHNNILMKTNLMIDVASAGYVDIEEFLSAF